MRSKIKRQGNIPGAMKKKAWLFCYLMLIPAAWAIVQYLIVNFGSLAIAFVDGEPFSSPFTWRNFEMLFNDMRIRDSILHTSILNTFKYFGIGFLKIAFSFLIAYFLYKKLLGYTTFRFLFFLPSVIAPVISVTIFKSLIERYGPLWEIVKALSGHEYGDLLTDPATATPVILFYVLFIAGFGTNFLILMGAMNRLPEEYFEAAQIDGCGQWKEFWLLVLPLTWETLSTLILLHLTTVFTATGPILYFTGGDYQTFTLTYWIFDQVRGGSYNYSSAVGIFFTVLAVPFVFGVRWLMNRINPEVTY